MHHVRNVMLANSNHAIVEAGFCNTSIERAAIHNRPTTNNVKEIFRLTRLLILMIFIEFFL